MKDFPLFKDVPSPLLRTWNRLNILYNIKESMGNTMSHKYMENFKLPAKLQIIAMHEKVKSEGYSEVRREIFRKTQ